MHKKNKRDDFQIEITDEKIIISRKFLEHVYIKEEMGD